MSEILKPFSKILTGCCSEVLETLADNSVDAIVTDPPYGLSFMGKKWDYDVPSVEIWRECFRVLKPGGHLLSFAGTRTQHRMACNIEDAGFEIRDMIAWVYGSGFPKSLNIGKAVDKIQGNEREDLGTIRKHHIGGVNANEGWNRPSHFEADGITPKRTMQITKGTSEWEGWGTALKPALEPITLARKPLEKGLTVAENCLKWGTGGINIDGCRVKFENNERENLYRPMTENKSIGWKNTSKAMGYNTEDGLPPENGRFPANLIHDGSQEVLELFPMTKSGSIKAGRPNGTSFSIGGELGKRISKYDTQGDSGSAARFFYCAKSSRSERNKGLDCYLTVKYNIPKTGGVLCEEVTVAVQLLQRVMSGQELVSFSIGESGASIMAQCHKDSLSTILTEINRIIELKTLNLLMHLLTRESTPVVNCETENGGNRVENAENLKKFLLTITKGNRELALGASHVVFQMLQLISAKENWKDATNFHSTVKPIALMEYLVKLVSREGQTVLDPFAGSGTTGIACKNLNRNAILIEREAEYVEIAKCRIAV